MPAALIWIWRLGSALATGTALFGAGRSVMHHVFPASPPGSPPPPGGDGGAGGSAAAAEADAAADLAKKTTTLQGLDAELAAVAGQIADDNDAAKQKLLAVKADIDKELEYLKTSGDSSVVKDQAVNKFLQDKAGDAASVLTDAAKSIEAHRGTITGVGNGFGGAGTDQPGAGGQQVGGAGGYAGGDGMGGGYDSGSYGSGGDPGGGLGDAAGLLPQMASAIPGALGGPLNGLGGLGDLLAQRDALARQTEPDATLAKSTEPDEKAKTDEKSATPAGNGTGAGDENANMDGNGAQPISASGQGDQPAPPPAPTMVVLPDGSNATADSPQLAAASRAHLGGQSLEDAYRAAGLTLPPAGTTVTDSLASVSDARIGDLAAFKDRYVMMLGDHKVYLDGVVQPDSALAKLTGFLGFRRGPQPLAAAGAPAAPVQVAATAPMVS